MQKYSLVLICVLLASCATSGERPSVYQQLGGQDRVVDIVDNFIAEIEFNAVIFNYFKQSDIDRFREKLAEHLCSLTGGPCEYTGDSMEQVHAGMNMSEGDFNLGVDLLIKAMTQSDVPHPLQNKVLNILAKTRHSMIYK